MAKGNFTIYSYKSIIYYPTKIVKFRYCFITYTIHHDNGNTIKNIKNGAIKTYSDKYMPTSSCSTAQRMMIWWTIYIPIEHSSNDFTPPH